METSNIWDTLLGLTNGSSDHSLSRSFSNFRLSNLSASNEIIRGVPGISDFNLSNKRFTADHARKFFAFLLMNTAFFVNAFLQTVIVIKVGQSPDKQMPDLENPLEPSTYAFPLGVS
jgi:hypothetical protein